MVSHGIYTRCQHYERLCKVVLYLSDEDVLQTVVRIIKDEKVVLVCLNGHTRLGHHPHREISCCHIK